MGPRLFSRGNGLNLEHPDIEISVLQWGRDSSVAEIIKTKSDGWRIMSLQWGRDSSVAEMMVDVAGRPPLCRPSMGPRLFSRGNNFKIAVETGLCALQWGRDSSVAEMRRFRIRRAPGDAALQWGRDSSVAEMAHCG